MLIVKGSEEQHKYVVEWNSEDQIMSVICQKHFKVSCITLRVEIKSFGKFAIFYLYKIGGGRGSAGTFGKIDVQDSIFA